MMCLESRLNYPPLGAPLTPLGLKPVSLCPPRTVGMGGGGGISHPILAEGVEVYCYVFFSKAKNTLHKKCLHDGSFDKLLTGFFVCNVFEPLKNYT